jgi:arylsulfatase A-like enzyme
VFENAYTVYPETIKSFFAVQCAVHPALDTTPEMYEKVHTPGLASLLAEQGYRTGLFHSGRFVYLGMDSVIRNRGYDTLEDAGDIGGDHKSSFGIDEPSTVRRILQWIDALPPGQRFLVTYLPIAGHHPYETPEPGPFPETDDLNRYRNALHYADAALAQLYDGLHARHLDQNTLFVFLGDHGEAFGEHDGNRGHTLFIYEENVRVPFIVMAPGVIQERVRVSGIASLVDTAPTVLDLLGLQAPASYQGRSLLESPSRMALFCTDYTLGLLGLRDGRWKLIHELESGRSRLYDLDEDPEERNDMGGLFPERAQAYREHLLRWAAAQKYRIIRGR